MCLNCGKRAEKFFKNMKMRRIYMEHRKYHVAKKEPKSVKNVSEKRAKSKVNNFLNGRIYWKDFHPRRKVDQFRKIRNSCVCAKRILKNCAKVKTC